MATAPVFSLSTTGGVPKIASKGNLEAGINSGFATLQSRIDALSIAATLGFPTFDSTAEGIAGVADGETFSVVGENLVDLYRRSGASATAVAAIPQLDAAIKGVTEQGWKSRGTTEPSHANYKVQIGSTWYSPDWLTVLVTGQSNPKGNSAATNGDKTGAGDVWVWNGYTAGTTGAAVEVAGDAIVEAALGAVPFNTAEGTVNNMAFHAAHRMSVALRRPVLIVMTAVGGTGINDWDPSSGGFWSAMDTAITDALADGDLWGTEKVDLFMMGWGEDAYNLTTNMWTLGDSRLPEIITAAKAASWASEDIFFAATLPVQEADGGDAWQVSREWIKIAASGKYANFAVVPSDGLALTGEDVGLQVHFDGASLQELGYRTADIYLGKSAGVTSDSSYPRGLPNTETFRAQPMVLLGEMLFDPTDPDDDGGDPDEVQVASGASGIPVLYVKDDGGTITRDGGTTTGGSPAYSHTVDSTNRVRLRAYAAAAAARDNPVRLNIGAGEPAGENSLTSLVIPPDAPLSQIYLTGPTNLKGRVIAADIPRTVETLRLQDAPGLDFSDFVAEDMPPGLTYLNLTGCLVPNNVKAAIDAENIARGGMITVVHGEEAGFTETRTFTSVTEMTNAITDGFSQLDGRVAFISNPTTGAFTTLQAKAGVAATPGEAPAGWQIVNRSGDFLDTDELEDFVDANGVFANGVISYAGELAFMWNKANTLTLTGSVTVVTGETLTQDQGSGVTATGIVEEGGTGASFNVVTVQGNFDTTNQLSGSTSGALGANSVPSNVADYTRLTGKKGLIPAGTDVHLYHFCKPSTADKSEAVAEFAAFTRYDRKVTKHLPGGDIAIPSLVSGGNNHLWSDDDVVGNDTRFIISETDASENTRVTWGSGEYADFEYHFETDSGTGDAHYIRRLSNAVGDSGKFKRIKFTSEADQPKAAATASRHTTFKLSADNLDLDGLLFDGIYHAMAGNEDGQAHFAKITGCTFKRWASAISLKGVMDDADISDCRAVTMNVNADPDAGRNMVTGASERVRIGPMKGENAPEHMWYNAGGSVFSGMTDGMHLHDLTAEYIGQNAYKARGLSGLRITDISAKYMNFGTAAGPNENFLHFEECYDVKVSGATGGTVDGVGSGGYIGLYLNSVQDFRGTDISLRDVDENFIEILDTRVPGYCQDIKLKGPSTEAANKTVLRIKASGNLGDIDITNAYIGANTGNLIELDPGYDATLDDDLDASQTYVAMTAATSEDKIVDPAYPPSDPHGAYAILVNAEQMLVTSINSGILATDIGTSDTSIAFEAGHGFLDPATVGNYEIDLGGQHTDADERETVTVTALSGNTLTVTRNASPQSFSAGDYARGNMATVTRAHDSTTATTHTASDDVKAQTTVGTIRLHGHIEAPDSLANILVATRAGEAVQVITDTHHWIGGVLLSKLDAEGHRWHYPQAKYDRTHGNSFAPIIIQGTAIGGVQGDATPVILATGPNTNDFNAAIVAIQTGADPEQVGWALFGQTSATFGANSLELVTFDHDGNMDLPRTGAELRIEGAKVLGAPIINAALANSANTGDANSDALLEALRDLVLAQGFGASS